MTDQERNQLAQALEQLSAALEKNPAPVIGMHVSVTAGPGQRGPVIGHKVSVTVEPGATGTVIGQMISVTAGQRNEQEVQLIKELNEAAQQVRAATAPEPWLSGLVSRVQGLGIKAIESAVGEVTKQLVAASF